jgi:C1A family cysteine protease
MCEPHEVFDGHSVLLSGYRDEPSHSGGGLFLIRNSGGPERHGAFPHAYARTYMNDAAWIEPTLAPVR